MATFQARVEGLTGVGTLSSDTNPTLNELTEFLKDGVLDVTGRLLSIDPLKVTLFTRKTASDSQGVEVGRAQIITVLREANADGSADNSTAWRTCRQIPIGLQSRVVDKDSLEYASMFSPVYAIDDTGVINVYPAPSSDNGIEVYYVNNTPVNDSDASLTYAHDAIKYFPSDKIYLVVMYAAIKCLEARMAEFAIDEEDVEMVQAITQNLSTLKQEYNAAFGLISSKKDRGER